MRISLIIQRVLLYTANSIGVSLTRNFMLVTSCLFMSGKGHCQIRYKLEVTNTSVPRQDEKCWLAPFMPDNDCFEFTPVAHIYEGKELGYNELESIGVSRYVQYSVLNEEQINFIDKYFE